jgi:dTDP-4-dehydrorhamnose reductase
MKTYTDTKSAAEIIINIIKNPSEGLVLKPKAEMLSSMHDRAEDVLKHLGID